MNLGTEKALRFHLLAKKWKLTSVAPRLDSGVRMHERESPLNGVSARLWTGRPAGFSVSQGPHGRSDAKVHSKSLV